MKPAIVFILLVGQLRLAAQFSIPTFNSGNNDTATFMQLFPRKADFILAYSAENYWWSNVENFLLVSRTENIWIAWKYFRKWKSSSDVKENGSKKKKKYFKKVQSLDSFAIKELFDSLTLIKFWSLNIDSLNETRGNIVSDETYYKFQIENFTGRKIIESYAPEYYIYKFPDMFQRATFLWGKEIFIRWWKRYCR